MYLKLDGKILVVDDDQHILFTTKLALKDRFTTLRTESTPQGLREILKEEYFDVLLLDMNFTPGMSSGKEGLQWLKVVKEVSPDTQVVMLASYGDSDAALLAIREGATDFMNKPLDREKLVSAVTTVYWLSQSNKRVRYLQARQRALQQELSIQPEEIIAYSPAMRTVMQAVKEAAASEANVLIHGENGTGKDIIARAIHRLSARAHEVFVKVEVNQTPIPVLEPTLFGLVIDPFITDPGDRPGKLEIASGGTLYLDEVGNLPLPLQNKLLSAMESRQVTRIGARNPVSVDVRLVSAANPRRPGSGPESGSGSDAFRKLGAVEIHLPLLRDRKEDIPYLVEHFLTQFSRKYQKDGMQLAAGTNRLLQQYGWPGNVRELKQSIERAVLVCDGFILSAGDILGTPAAPAKASRPVTSFHLEDIERKTISEAIKRYEGNLSRAAVELGLGRSTLYRKMEKYGIGQEES
jgi:DNA-binding NtrC family response regulator